MYDIIDQATYDQADGEAAALRTLLNQLDGMEMFLAAPDIDIDKSDEFGAIRTDLNNAILDREAACDEWERPQARWNARGYG